MKSIISNNDAFTGAFTKDIPVTICFVWTLAFWLILSMLILPYKGKAKIPKVQTK